MPKEWLKLYETAKNNLTTNEISSFVTCGNYSCVIETNNKKIYNGIDIKSNSKLESKAEDIAIINMISNKETTVKRIILINELEEIIMPNKESLINLLALSYDNLNTEIIINENEIKKLSELLPDWWGTYKPIKK